MHRHSVLGPSCRGTTPSPPPFCCRCSCQLVEKLSLQSDAIRASGVPSRGHRAGCKWGTETGKVIEKVANSLAKRLAFFLGNDSFGRCKSGPRALINCTNVIKFLAAFPLKNKCLLSRL